MSRAHALALLLALAALGVAGAAAVAIVERPGSPVGIPTVTPAFSPDGDGRKDVATVRFDVSRRDRVTVDILDEDAKQVARPLDGERLHGRQQVRWDGRTAGGDAAPEGTYRARLRLHEAGRTFDVDSPIRLDLTPPTIERATLDTSRLSTLDVVRVDVQASGSTERYLEYRGKRLPTLRIVRPEQLRRDRSFRQFRISARVPGRASRDDMSALRLVLSDAAGNTTRVRPGGNPA